MISKIQYQHSEPGEFIDKKDRTFEETTALIEEYPWEEQREHMPVGIGGSSVTIEDGLGEYLKLAPYFHGKFVLYYLDAAGHLYTKSFPDYQGSFPFIQAFFEHRLDTADFQLERFWMQGKAIHFKDMDFHFTPKKAGILLTMTLIGAYCAAMISILVTLLFMVPLNIPGLVIIPAIFGLFVLFIAGKFAMFINYYRVAHDKMLILSRGNDLFYYGVIGHLQEFNKKEILGIVTYGPTGGRRMEIDGFIKMEMRTGDLIYIPYMVLHMGPLLDKLRGCPQRHQFSWFPFIPLSAASPS